MPTLLVVDDDADQLSVRAMVLRREGYTVLESSDVAGALAHGAADLVVMDMIPGALSLIESIGSRAPIIVLTGRAVDGLPVARVLRKPCRSRVLIDTIAELLA